MTNDSGHARAALVKICYMYPLEAISSHTVRDVLWGGGGGGRASLNYVELMPTDVRPMVYFGVSVERVLRSA